MGGRELGVGEVDDLVAGKGLGHAAAAGYIATLARELAVIARRHGLEPLGYILDMARLEADQIVKDTASASGHD